MTCDAALEYISRLVDEDLTAEESDALYEHMRGCADCCAVFAAFSSVSAANREHTAEPPARLNERVMRAIKRHNAEKKLFPLPKALRVTLPAAACFVVLAIGALTLLPRIQTMGRGTETMEEAAFVSMSAAEPENAIAEADVVTNAGEPENAIAEAEETINAEEPENASAEAAVVTSAEEPVDETADEPVDATAEAAEATMAEEPASGRPSPVAVYAEGEYLGLIAADAVDLDALFAGDVTELPEEITACYQLDRSGVSYRVQVTEDSLYWQTEGERDWHLSALPAEVFTALLP